MKLTLAENIRTFRKERGYTQEQRAELLGVTTGAVYKWESGQSVPELRLIVEMADVFDVSVDTLLGFRMKDNRMEAVQKRIDALLRHRDPEALIEAEKALKKYPYSFEIVLGCAEAYLFFATGSRGGKEARRALELLERARLLQDQNKDPHVGELTICSKMAEAYDLMGEREASVELLKKHNLHGVFNDLIGCRLSLRLHRPAEAEPYLSDALLQVVFSLTDTVFGYVPVFCARGETPSAREILQWGLGIIRGLKKEDAPDFLDKICAAFLTLLAHTQLLEGGKREAADSLRKADELVRRFDSSPDYSVSSIRYVTDPEQIRVYDTLGATAEESVAELLEELGSQELSQLWEEVRRRG